MTRLSGRRIMVVEDSYLLAMEAGSALIEAGAEVIGPFADAKKAHHSLTDRPPDAVVLDVNLDGSNTFDLARTLRMRRIPFLFFTGYDQNALPSEFTDAERLEKPLDAARLVQAVERCCRSVST